MLGLLHSHGQRLGALRFTAQCTASVYSRAGVPDTSWESDGSSAPCGSEAWVVITDHDSLELSYNSVGCQLAEAKAMAG